MSNPPPEQSEAIVGIVVVDHGSRRAESNDLLLEVAALFQQVSGYEIVEPAHMELAEPTIAQAFSRCVGQGANLVVVHPYFLSPGRHWSQDIPRLAAEAASQHPGIRHLVTSPLGLHRQLAEVMRHRIETCLAHTHAGGPPCDLCAENGGCQIQEGAS
ncbi:MAG: CbiX/SirB N-terminal domain-containing protein [Pirellulaceae bacterium]